MFSPWDYGSRGQEAASENRISAQAQRETIEAIRKGLREHAREIRIRFTIPGELPEDLTLLVKDWMESALGETARPDEGDYLRYQYGGYRLDCGCERKADGSYAYSARIVPEYYGYLVQEEEAGAVLQEILEGFGFDASSTDYDKIFRIYDYLCRTVRYDRVHSGRKRHTLRSTAYSALHYHAATCQGYCVVLYRLLRMAGLDCRIVSGEAGGRYHSWNIVRLGWQYYHLDATWDAGQDQYRYFLKGNAGFRDHNLAPSYRTQSFCLRHPLSPFDYRAGETTRSQGEDEGQK